MRADESILVTVANWNEMRFVPTPGDRLPVAPQHLFTVAFNATFVVEWRPERFLVGVAEVYNIKEARLYEVDMTDWSPGTHVASRHILTLPRPWVGLNGCLVAPDALLAAGMAKLVWLRNDTVKNRPWQEEAEAARHQRRPVRYRDRPSLSNDDLAAADAAGEVTCPRTLIQPRLEPSG